LNDVSNKDKGVEDINVSLTVKKAERMLDFLANPHNDTGFQVNPGQPTLLKNGFLYPSESECPSGRVRCFAYIVNEQVAATCFVSTVLLLASKKYPKITSRPRRWKILWERIRKEHYRISNAPEEPIEVRETNINAYLVDIVARDPEYRGQQKGARIMKFVEKRLADNGADILFLVATKEKFYIEGLGYRTVENHQCNILPPFDMAENYKYLLYKRLIKPGMEVSELSDDTALHIVGSRSVMDIDTWR